MTLLTETPSGSESLTHDRTWTVQKMTVSCASQPNGSRFVQHCCTALGCLAPGATHQLCTECGPARPAHRSSYMSLTCSISQSLAHERPLHWLAASWFCNMRRLPLGVACLRILCYRPFSNPPPAVIEKLPPSRGRGAAAALCDRGLKGCAAEHRPTAAAAA